ncbi:hypothetical protein TRVA0_004S01222 [Trichomonascus vanleenenianus]|uniref:uncharacterized protein n=1 Tax=Trichomonascus vanleenenianus TaxID=2268995 RepID=UPI003ECA364B
MQSPTLDSASSTPTKSFEDMFIQNAKAYAEMKPVPQAHEDYEPYLSHYTEYDSMVPESSSHIQDLYIPPIGENRGNHDEDETPSIGMYETITPATLAKFSRALNMGSPTREDLALTPESSPVKPISSLQMSPGTHSLSTSPYQSSSPLHQSPLGSPTKNNPLPNQALMNRSVPSLPPPPQPAFNPRGIYSIDSESEAHAISSPEAYSPVPSPEYSGEYHRSNHSPSSSISGQVAVYSSLNMQQLNQPQQQNTIDWRPIVTAPIQKEVQELIRSQRSPAKQSTSKSCLPPGKVESYLVGPNADGLFECLYPNCGKFFRRRYNARSHIQTHLCDRPYGCDVCGACFVRPHDLRRHEKCHQDDRPHVCPCGKAFTRHDALQRHRVRMICSGGIEIPGKPKRVPAKRGRPRKKPLDEDADAMDQGVSYDSNVLGTHQPQFPFPMSSESESENNRSSVSSPEQEYDYQQHHPPPLALNNGGFMMKHRQQPGDQYLVKPEPSNMWG